MLALRRMNLITALQSYSLSFLIQRSNFCILWVRTLLSKAF
ncbi:UNVERIFIED_CONTAM: hypothetical protein GTU68_020677 [Idotea baltica]|nr:hypothetical protein [Idotea baltica]